MSPRSCPQYFSPTYLHFLSRETVLALWVLNPIYLLRTSKYKHLDFFFPELHLCIFSCQFYGLRLTDLTRDTSFPGSKIFPVSVVQNTVNLSLLWISLKFTPLKSSRVKEIQNFYNTVLTLYSSALRLLSHLP